MYCTFDQNQLAGIFEGQFDITTGKALPNVPLRVSGEIILIADLFNASGPLWYQPQDFVKVQVLT